MPITDNGIEYDEIVDTDEALPCGIGTIRSYQKAGVEVRRDYHVAVSVEAAQRMGLPGFEMKGKT